MSDKILGGDVTAQYSASTEEGLPIAMALCRQQQEDICGYPLVVKSERKTHFVIGDGASAQDVYEVFVTFSPKPADGVDGAGV